MNTQVKPIDAVTQGAVHAVTSLLGHIFEAMVEDSKEQGRLLREKQRGEVLRMIKNGQKVKLYALQMMVKMRDLPLSSIATELNIPESELKTIVKPWWHLF
jgi:DNA-directed RNA polymerase specialized sigma24 family protein